MAVTKRAVANLLALEVLSYLTMRPMHPYEMSRTIRDNDDGRSIKFNHGSLYMVFRQLEKAGFIVEHETNRAGQRPERTLYALTDEGRVELNDWLRDLIEHPQHEFPQFVGALSLIAALPPDDVVTMLKRRLQLLAEQQDAIQKLIDGAVAGGLHPLFLVEEEYRLALLAAEVSFAQGFIKRITNSKTGWRRLWQGFQSKPAPSSTKG